MAEHDGNGWVDCRCGSRHWGRHGAAGLLLLRTPHGAHDAHDVGGPVNANGGRPEVLLQLRAAWTHQGGSWGLPGGARDSHEDPVTAALREAAEEAGVAPDAVTVIDQLPGVDHGDWSYIYVVAHAAPTLAVTPLTAESDELRWVSLDAVGHLPLHPSFDAAWPRLHAGLRNGSTGPADAGADPLTGG